MKIYSYPLYNTLFSRRMTRSSAKNHLNFVIIILHACARQRISQNNCKNNNERENRKLLVIICYYYKYTRMVTLSRDDSLSIISFHTRSSHVPGIPFCPFCPCDPFSPSMKKQAYKKRLYGMDLEKRTCFAICH